jgi:WD40 repeat protein
VATLDGHSHNVSVRFFLAQHFWNPQKRRKLIFPEFFQFLKAVCFHPSLPVIITGSEDSTVRIWHANTHRYISTDKLHVSLVL